MTIGFVFWLLMLFWFFFRAYSNRAAFGAGDYGLLGGSLLEFVLFFLLGWKVFGFPIRG